MAEATETIGLLLSDDLIFTSRIVGVARDLGFKVKAARSADALLSLARQLPPRCVILDLANPDLDLVGLIAQLGTVGVNLPRIVAYGSHVDTESLRAARAAGCVPVLPRSKFVEELPMALPQWLAEPEC
jgi:CheY-like chemotaxis protein